MTDISLADELTLIDETQVIIVPAIQQLAEPVPVVIPKIKKPNQTDDEKRKKNREIKRKWRKENPDIVAERNRQYYKEHRGKK